MTQLQILKATRSELRQAKACIAHVAPKAEAYDILSAVVRAMWHQPMCAQESAAEDLDQLIDTMEKEAAKPKPVRRPRKK